MRAVKTVLCSSYKLKLQQGFSTEATFESEASLIIKAVSDTIAPKFTANDLVLFKNIIRDLLPGCEALCAERSELETILIKEIASRGLQATPWYLGKVLQLYEALQSQHGVMLVGDPFAGKTSAYQVIIINYYVYLKSKEN
jgi:dynein heavy chain